MIDWMDANCENGCRLPRLEIVTYKGEDMNFKGETEYKECRLCKAARSAYQALSRVERGEISGACEERWDFECGNAVILNQMKPEGEQETWQDSGCKNAAEVALELKAQMEAQEDAGE